MTSSDWHEVLYARCAAEWDYFDAREQFHIARQELRECRASDWPRRHLAPLVRELAIWGRFARRRKANLRALLALEAARRAAFDAETDIECLVESFHGHAHYDRLAAEYRHYRLAAEEMALALPILRRLKAIVDVIIRLDEQTPQEAAVRDALAPWIRWDEQGREGAIGPGGYYRPAGKNNAGMGWVEIEGPDGLTQEERATAIEAARAKKEKRRPRKLDGHAPRPY